MSNDVHTPLFYCFLGNHLVKDYSPWRLEYIAGMSNEIYIIDFKEDKCSLYIGKPFH